MRHTILRVVAVLLVAAALALVWKQVSMAPGPQTVAPVIEATARDRAMQAVMALKERDMGEFSTFVHPDGVRFFPYTYIDISAAEPIKPDVVKAFPTLSSVRTWGIQDGSGEPIVLPVMQYIDRFVYDGDFAAATDIRENDTTSQGNIQNNVVASFPGTTVISFHLPPENPDYGGMDWKNLRLVMEQKDGVWYVVAIVHDAWTI